MLSGVEQTLFISDSQPVYVQTMHVQPKARTDTHSMCLVYQMQAQMLLIAQLSLLFSNDAMSARLNLLYINDAMSVQVTSLCSDNALSKQVNLPTS